MNGTLIRDNIPALVEKQGNLCNYAEVKSDYVFHNLLRDKLMEVVNMFLQTNTRESLAEVKTVVEAIIDTDPETFNEIYEKQMQEAGGYTKKYIFLQADYVPVKEAVEEFGTAQK